MGKWYWNGKIGFKIPALHHFPVSSSIDLDQFIPLTLVGGIASQPSPHSVAEPSVYTITFTSPSTALVTHNLYGARPALLPDVVWTDGISSFKINSSTVPFVAGDSIKVYLAPTESFVIGGFYDQLPYDAFPYDVSGDVYSPTLANQEIFPLKYGHGTVIFETCSLGDKVIIDKAQIEQIRLQIIGASSNHPILGAVNDWVPLEFRYNNNFSDLATLISAYSSATGLLVFTISQPQYGTTDRNSSALLTFDSTFLLTYLPQQTKFTLMFLPTDSYGQVIRVKISENIKITPDINITEGVSPGYLGTVLTDGLTMSEYTVSAPLVVDRFSVFFDLSLYPSSGNGMTISSSATTYLITDNGTNPTPSLRVESLSNLGVYGHPTPNFHSMTQLPSLSSLRSFTFTLPGGFNVPFKLRVS